jgi:hypothetical protein
MKINSKSFCLPFFIRKLRDEQKLSGSQIGNIVGCSNTHINSSLRNGKIKKCYEIAAEVYYTNHYKQKDLPKPVVKENVVDDTVLMVVIKKNNVDFLTRIVRSLKGEITEV